jgi:alpha-amylase
MRGSFKASFSVSGIALEQMALYTPAMTETFRELAASGCAEFLGGTYSNSLASLSGGEVFRDQVDLQTEAIENLTGQHPEVFLNSEMIYSDHIGSMVADLGYKAAIVGGASQVLGWRSPEYLYCNAVQPKLKLFFRDERLSRILSDGFTGNTGITPEGLLAEICSIPVEDAQVNICIAAENSGGLSLGNRDALGFLDHFIFLATQTPEICFCTPSEVVDKLQPVSLISVTNPVSWADDDHTISLWTGNVIQQEALTKLYEIAPHFIEHRNPGIFRDWKMLQSSDHFLQMTTKPVPENLIFNLNPFRSPFEAFINYMNILSDLKIRMGLNDQGKSQRPEMEELRKRLKEKELQIERYRKEIHHLKQERKKQA